MPHPAPQTSLWETVKCDLKGLFPEDVFQMWFEPMSCLEANEDAVVLGVPNDFAAIWIHDNYLDLISQRIRLTAGRLVHVSLRKSDPASGVSTPVPVRVEPVRNRTAAKSRVVRYDERAANAGALNPRNTFENFVVGSNNQLAHAAALAVAQAPAQAYNPLFIHGSTGLGKVTLVTVSEFGRRVTENGSRGLDHGYGNAMFVLGGGVRGKRVYGTWPGLVPANLRAGDLAVTTDYRAVIGEILRKRCGVGSLSSIFPGVTPTSYGLVTAR